MTEHRQHKVIVIEGPPGSGKDLMGDVVNRYIKQHAPWLQVELCEMAARVKKAVHVLFGLFEEPIQFNVTKNEEGVRLKDVPHRDLLPHPMTFGIRMTPREAYVSLIEEYVRSTFGLSALGHMMESELRRSKCDVHIFNGIGHYCELEPIVSYVGARNLLVIQLASSNATQDGRVGVAGAVRDKLPKSTVVTIPPAITIDTQRDLLRVLCEGAVKKFLGLDHED
jgi:hypothetical protein